MTRDRFGPPPDRVPDRGKPWLNPYTKAAALSVGGTMILIAVGLAVVFFVMLSREGGGGLITRDDFAQLRDGMTYREVAVIMRRDGELVSRTAVGLEDMEVYAWRNWDGSAVSCVFLNGRLANRTQNGIP